MLYTKKFITSLIIFFVGVLSIVALGVSSKAFAGECPQVTDSSANLADQGLAEFYYSFYRTTGDVQYLGLSGSTQATVYAGGDGKGYLSDPEDCGDSSSGGWATRTLAGMSVHIYTPSGSPSVTPHVAGKRPLMLALHGCNQSNTVMRDLGNWATTADMYDLVVAVPDSVNAAAGNCWDSFGDNHSHLTRDSDNVIALTEQLRDDQAYAIDAQQIYISGLSSGGMQSMLVGCMRPDLYAGMGLNANPTIGTEGLDEWGSDPQGPSEGLTMCLDLAAATGNSPSFSTQLTSVVFGDDSITPGGTDEPYGQSIDLDFFPQNAEIMATIYDAQAATGSNTVAGYSSANDGVETWWVRNAVKRVSLLDIPGLGHAWPSGNGQQGTDINGSYVNYPAFVMAFFHSNNLRVQTGGNAPPSISLNGASDVELNVGDAWSDPGAQANDAEDGDLTSAIAVSGSVDTQTVGMYTLDYCVTDSEGLQSCTSRTVNVVSVSPECFEYTSMNYSHKSAGRAYSSGSYWSPQYFAVGSDTPISGSAFSTSTLYSYDNTVWEVGNCP